MAIQIDDHLNRTFHALGDESRRQMLAQLARQGKCSAGDLGASFNFSQPTISKHIKVLEVAGLVERQVEGRQHYFQLVQQNLDEAQRWIARHKKFWEGTLGQLEDILEEGGGS